MRIGLRLAVLLTAMALAVTTGAGFGMPAASAHTVLIASDPPSEAALSAGPGRVSATFNEDLQPAFAAMTVVGPDGNLWSQGDAEVRGPVVGVALRPLGPSGRYTVNYRVTSADGHVVSGSWSFTLTTSTTATPGPSAAPASPPQSIPLWPFAAGAAALAGAAAIWTLRRRK